jgi:hypothetical protein
MRRNGSRYNFLINKVFKKYFNPWLNSLRQSLFFKRLILHIDLKKSPNKNLKILKKVMLNANKIRNSSQSKFLDLYVFVPIKLIFKQFRLLGLLSYKKNKFCVNNSITFKNYEDIIKFYSTIIIRLLLYFQLADNWKSLKTLCIKLRKSCFLTLNLKYKSSKNHLLIFQRYYSFIKFKFTYKWSKLILINTILKYKRKFLLNHLFLNFNIEYIVWKCAALNNMCTK